MDVGTGVLVVRHYKHKSKTKNDIADILLEFTSRSGNQVRTVNFDRAGEYTSPATDQEFRRHGVRPVFMPAYDHNPAHLIEGIQFWIQKASDAYMHRGNAGRVWRAHAKQEAVYVRNHIPVYMEDEEDTSGAHCLSHEQA